MLYLWTLIIISQVYQIELKSYFRKSFKGVIVLQELYKVKV